MNNPPAFPQPFTDSTGLALEGMTLRDYFAAHAVTGILFYHEGAYETAAAKAYYVADAMLKAREKE